ncbi:MAG TPA: hypothetical protein DSN98_08885 [Thermoplasmata archaeon]|jgi:hypothetical protein|nr:MAG TPA: hypothetical protein DSN98_08885 [Thermoplasmata archaeon]
MVKSSTYASLVTMVFIVHRDAISKSIESVIRSTDQLCLKLGLQNDLSHMTKYRIIADLMHSRILVSQKTKKNMKLKFSQKINDLLE